MINIDRSNFIWQVESLRFTLFFPKKHGVTNLWESITGLPPQNRTERPQEGLLVEDGIWEDNTLAVSVRPERIDIVISSSPVDIPELPNIGDLEVIILKARNLLEKLHFDEVMRIAFGLILLHPEQDHSNAYQSLEKLLPNVSIESDASNFLYQVTLPIQSEIDSSIRINSLRRFSASLMRLINFNINGISNLNDVELFATRLELDINTNKETLLTQFFYWR